MVNQAELELLSRKLQRLPNAEKLPFMKAEIAKFDDPNDKSVADTMLSIGISWVFLKIKLMLVVS